MACVNGVKPRKKKIATEELDVNNQINKERKMMSATMVRQEMPAFEMEHTMPKQVISQAYPAKTIKISGLLFVFIPQISHLYVQQK